jgi:hypothetical protein
MPAILGEYKAKSRETLIRWCLNLNFLANFAAVPRRTSRLKALLWPENQTTLTAKGAKKGRKAREEIQTDARPLIQL